MIGLLLTALVVGFVRPGPPDAIHGVAGHAPNGP